jgi:PilZ domain
MSPDPLELVFSWSGVTNGVNGNYGALVERRKRARTRLRWPVLLFREHGSEAIESVTRDLSSGGFYCISGIRLNEGEKLICSITIPTHDPQGKHLARTLECRVQVLRVVPQESGNSFGVACRIEDYRLSQVRAPEV